jgi:hypothetical protein
MISDLLSSSLKASESSEEIVNSLSISSSFASSSKTLLESFSNSVSTFSRGPGSVFGGKRLVSIPTPLNPAAIVHVLTLSHALKSQLTRSGRLGGFNLNASLGSRGALTWL